MMLNLFQHATPGTAPPRSGVRRLLVVAILATLGTAASGCSSGGDGLFDDQGTVDSGPLERPEEAGGRDGTPPPGSDPVSPEQPLDPDPPVEPELSYAVFVNGVALDDLTIQLLEQDLGLSVAAGAYWYDPVSGAVGYEGGPTGGFLPPNLALGGALAEDASYGDTGVYLNGRELPIEDLQALEQIFLAPIPPDRYFLDAAGNYGYEGGYAIGNIFDVLEQQAAGGGGGPNETAGGWVGGSGDDGYYFDPETGCSVMSDGVSC